MGWSRNKSELEDLVISILESSNNPLCLNDLVHKIRAFNPKLLTGKTPKNSLYSVIYRREKRRSERGEAFVFSIEKVNNRIFIGLNSHA